MESLLEDVILVFESAGWMTDGMVEDVSSAEEEASVIVVGKVLAPGRPLSGVVIESSWSAVDADSLVGLGTGGGFSTRLSIRPILLTPDGSFPLKIAFTRPSGLRAKVLLSWETTCVPILEPS
jgi:hypothetical protein